MPFSSHRFPIKIINCSRLSSVLQLDAHPWILFSRLCVNRPPLPTITSYICQAGLLICFEQPYIFSACIHSAEFCLFRNHYLLRPCSTSLSEKPTIHQSRRKHGFVANRDLDMSSVFLSMAHRLPVTESLGLLIKNMESEFPDGDQELPIWFVGSLKFEIPASNMEGIILPLKPLLHRAFIEF